MISARGIAEDEVKQFFGIEIQAEKEIVFLVVKSEEKQEIMTAIMKAVGMKPKATALSCRFRYPTRSVWRIKPNRAPALYIV